MEAAKRHPSPTSTAEECAECARSSQCAACFEELVRRFQSPLLHFLIRRLGSRHDAEDVLQETFLTAHRKLASYSPSWRFSTWLFTIGYRLASTKKRRRRWFMPDGGRNANGKLSADDPHAAARDKERRHNLWDDVAQILDHDAFTAVWLSYVESMPADEIGRILGRSPNAVRILLHRARVRLTDQIGPRWRPGGDS
jgi:RNA polymerase sigma-70 factor (ECF subfamily)